ncbi:hypothetical protein M2G39_21075 [Vibrio vulnificus]|nr:hypothetical protein [Vibrio vulnificus]
MVCGGFSIALLTP